MYDPVIHRTGLGGSDMAAVMGLSNPNFGTTPLEVFLAKRGEAPPREFNRFAEWGLIHEPTILKVYSERERCRVVGWQRIAPEEEGGDPSYVLMVWDGGREYDLKTYAEDIAGISEDGEADLRELLDTIRHPEHDWLIGDLDGIIFDVKDDGSIVIVRAVDAKTSSERRAKEWGEGGTDDILNEYIPQGQTYAEILRALGYPVDVDFAVLIGGNDWRIYPLVHSPAFVKEMVAIGATFWQRILDDDPPAAGPTEADRIALSKIYPEETEETIVVEETESALFVRISEVIEARAAAKEAEGDKTAAENRLKDRIGDAIGIECPEVSANWKKNKDSEGTDWQAIARDVAEKLNVAYEDGGFDPFDIDEHAQGDDFQVVTKKGARVLRVKRKGDQ